jgi:CBS domain containing-hemolysin-like protein
MDSTLIFGIAIPLFFSFFFTCVEVAYMTANKSRIEEGAKTGSLNSRILLFFIQRPTWLIGSTRVGYCTSLVFFSYFMAQLLLPMVAKMLPKVLDHTVVTIFIQIILSSTLILLTAQFLPKVLGNIYPNRMLSFTAILFGFASLLLAPITYCILGITRLIVVHVLRQKFKEDNPLFGITNLNQYFKNIYNIRHENINLEFDKKILQNALEFKTVKIRECMIPRNEITAIDIQDGLEKLQRIFVESGHSKIIIYRNTIDDIIGYCHSSSLYRMPSKIEDILTPVITVHEASLASDLMRRFLNEKKSLAVVMDEFGGTSGIVSREDVIEEIFGEIEDEYDEDHLIEQKLDDFNYLLSARLEIDYLNEKYDWNLPIGEYETLGGLILAYTEDLPHQGETITITPYIFSIQATQGNRIDTIKLTLEPASQEL